MKLDLKKLSLALSIVIALTTIIYGTVKYLNVTYAYADDLKEHKLDTKYNFLHIKLEKINNRIWELESRLERGQKKNPDIKKEMEALKTDKELTIKTIQEIEAIKLK